MPVRLLSGAFKTLANPDALRPVCLEQDIETNPFLVAAGQQGLETDPHRVAILDIGPGQNAERRLGFGGTDNKVVDAQVLHEAYDTMGDGFDRHKHGQAALPISRLVTSGVTIFKSRSVLSRQINVDCTASRSSPMSLISRPTSAADQSRVSAIPGTFSRSSFLSSRTKWAISPASLASISGKRAAMIASSRSGSGKST